MTTKAAEDFEDIARRLKELEADRQLALTGSSAPVDLGKLGEYETGIGRLRTGHDYDPA